MSKPFFVPEDFKGDLTATEKNSLDNVCRSANAKRDREIDILRELVCELFNYLQDIIESGVVDCLECQRHEELALLALAKLKSAGFGDEK